MIEAKALLQAVIDPDGWICIAGKNDKTKGAPIHKFFAPGEYDAAIEQAVLFDKRGLGTYFCTSSLLTNENRTEANVAMVRVFKLDLDIGDSDKKYKTQKEAVMDIVRVCGETNLPQPVFVNSGYGVHVYWIGDKGLTSADAKLFLGRLKRIMHHHGVKSDAQCTSDTVRILRVPGTHNYKRESPKLVKLANPVVVYDMEVLISTINAANELVPADLIPEAPVAKHAPVSQVALFEGNVAIPAHIKSDSVDESMRSLMDFRPKLFSKILDKSEVKVGCAQLWDIYTNQDEQGNYDRWRAGLSIAYNCEDGEEAIHRISEKGKDYSHAATVAKALTTEGKPHTCRWFNANRPALCKKCPHAGKITSPIQLGEYIPIAPAHDNIVISHNKTVTTKDQEYPIPDYPGNYKRRLGGGVILPAADPTDDPKVVCEYDFYATQRLFSEEMGYLLQVQVHKPKDGTLDITIPTKDIGNKLLLQNWLNMYGIMVTDSAVVRAYLNAWLDKMEKAAVVNYVKEQFGWNDDFSSFVIGPMEYRATGGIYSPVAPSIRNIASNIKTVGSFDVWKSIINVYAMEGAEAYAFSALAGFGSALMGFTAYPGAVINLTSPKSGIGKSTTQQVQCSIWGHPTRMLSIKKDTSNARIHKFGVYKNLPMCVDEMTSAHVNDIKELLFEVSSGRGKERMVSSGNSLRNNNTSWASIITLSANTNFTELMQAKGVSLGELMRMIEISVPTLNHMSKQESDAIFSKLSHNYGHAGEIFIMEVLRDTQAVRDMMEEENNRFSTDPDFNMQQDERYWAAAFTCVYVGGVIAHRLGLHDIDMERIREWMKGQLVKMRAEVQTSKDKVGSASNLLGEFLATNVGRTVIAYSDAKSNTGYTCPTVPMNGVSVRFEPVEKRIYVLCSDFRKYCAATNMPLTDFLQAEAKSGSFLGEVPKRMMAGTAMPSVNARTYEFHMTEDTAAFMNGVIKGEL